MHTRYLDGLLLVTPNGGLDEATRRLLPPESHRSWSTVDANQHVLVAYRCDGRVPLAIGRLCRHGSRAEITCIAAATGPAAGPIVVRELEALARASGISDLKTVFQLGSRAER